MTYSISEAATRSGLPIHTLRYYEKEGLLPFVQRTPSGNRRFEQSDLDWLALINCLKGTGLQIKEIRTFIDWYKEGDGTLEKRLNLFRKQKSALEAQIKELKMHLKKINHKIKYYETACAAGTEKACDGMDEC